MKKVTVIGEIGADGKYGVYGGDVLKQFLRDNAKRRMALTIEVLPDDWTSGQRYFYHNVIIPRVHDALTELGWEMREIDVDAYLRIESGIAGKDMESMKRLIDYAIRFASRDLGIVITTP